MASSASGLLVPHDFSDMYSSLAPADEGIAALPTDVGIGFMCGLTGGSVYHFLKAGRRHKTLSAGINAVRANSIRVGGLGALFSILTNVTAYTISRVGGEQTFEWNATPSAAIAAAIMYAPSGLRSSARAALAFGALFAATNLNHIFNKTV